MEYGAFSFFMHFVLSCLHTRDRLDDPEESAEGYRPFCKDHEAGQHEGCCDGLGSVASTREAS